MTRTNKAVDFVGAAMVIVIGLYVVAVMIQQLMTNNPLFASMMYGGGVITAIVIGAIAVLKVKGR
jgi:hypothetical protein